MKLVLINGEACVKKEVKNENVYRTLAANKVIGLPEIMRIESGVIYYKYVNGETLKGRLENDDHVSKEFIRFLIFSCSKILSHLREINVVHNDITPENIVITPKGEVYIIDLESATFEEKADSTAERNISEYSSPELKNGEITTYQSDIYSLGKILEEIDKGSLFENITQKCLKEDKELRYTSYTALSHEISARYAVVDDVEVKFSFLEYFSPRKIITVLLIGLFGGVVGYYLSSTVENSSTALYILFSVYTFLALLDIFDYIRVLMFNENLYRKILPMKFVISMVMFFTAVSIVLLLQ